MQIHHMAVRREMLRWFIQGLLVCHKDNQDCLDHNLLFLVFQHSKQTCADLTVVCQSGINREQRQAKLKLVK